MISLFSLGNKINAQRPKIKEGYRSTWSEIMKLSSGASAWRSLGYSVLQYVTLCYNMLQSVTVLQCVTVCHSCSETSSIAFHFHF